MTITDHFCISLLQRKQLTFPAYQRDMRRQGDRSDLRHQREGLALSSVIAAPLLDQQVEASCLFQRRHTQLHFQDSFTLLILAQGGIVLPGLSIELHELAVGGFV